MMNFVGREMEVDRYLEILECFLKEYAEKFASGKEAHRKSFVFNVYGFGGVGKTSLLKRYHDIMRDKAGKYDNVFSTYIDTSGYDNFVEVLYKMRSEMGPFFNDPNVYDNDIFFEFDSVYAFFYGQKTGGEIADKPLILQILHEILQNVSLSDFLHIDVLDTMWSIELNGMTIETGGLAQAVIEGILRTLPVMFSSVSNLRGRWKSRQEQEELESRLEEIKDSIGSVYQREQYLLAKFIESTSKLAADNPMVFLIDNLQSAGDYGNLLRNYTWLTGPRGIVLSLPGLYILGGRDTLEYLLEDCQKSIKYDSMELLGVTFEEIREFYRGNCGLDFIKPLATVEMRMIKAALIGAEDKESAETELKEVNLENGRYLPIIMKLAADHYNQLREEKKRKGLNEPVSAEELGAIDEFADLSYYFELNLSDMIRDVFYILSCIDVWDEKWFRRVKERFDNYLLNAVHVLRSFSSLEALDSNKIKVHDLVRSKLYASPKNQLKDDVQEWLFIYFLHMQDVHQESDIVFVDEPALVEDLSELDVYANVCINYINRIKDKEQERFTCTQALGYLRDAFEKSIELYESEERVNDKIIDIVCFLADRTEKILPDSVFELDYRRHLTLLLSAASYNNAAMKESRTLLKKCKKQVAAIPEKGRTFENYVKVYSERGNAFNSLAYDLGENWDYRKAASLGFRAVKDQYELLENALPYLDLTEEEQDAFRKIVGMCRWGNYACDEETLDVCASVLKKSSFYQEKEQGKTDGIIRRYLKARGNIPWYYLRLPVHERETYGEFDPVAFGIQTYQLRRAFYGPSLFSILSRHNASVYLKMQKKYREALELSDSVYEEELAYLKTSEVPELSEQQMEEKLLQLKALGLISEDRINQTFHAYRHLLLYDPHIIEVLQYNSNFNLCIVLASECGGDDRVGFMRSAREKGEAAVILRWLTMKEKADKLLTSWSYLASDYYALEKYDEAVEIVRYVIRQLEEGRVEERMGVNRLKLQEHRTMLYEMERHVWSENHRFGE